MAFSPRKTDSQQIEHARRKVKLPSARKNVDDKFHIADTYIHSYVHIEGYSNPVYDEEAGASFKPCSHRRPLLASFD